MDSYDVFIEIGRKKVFAGALDWPGWSRGGRDEGSALQILFEYGSRYAQVMHAEDIKFQKPKDVSSFNVVEQHGSDSTTDFGAPSRVLDIDKRTLERGEYERLMQLLQACWGKFDLEVKRAAGRELRKGPHGGGRDLEKVIDHILDAEKAYLSRLSWKYSINEGQDRVVELRRMREAILDVLEASMRGEIPEKGPRGGVIWPARYFVRRTAWHVLDHAWEIEDRI